MIIKNIIQNVMMITDAGIMIRIIILQERIIQGIITGDGRIF